VAKDTGVDLRGQVMYSCFVRNYSAEGTFKALEADLDRVKRLGVDIIWLLPVHPIGKKARIGTLGSPYAIADYRAINPEYGSREDFISLVDSIHRRDMKCVIDVVYNHTSPDSFLAQRHPEWFYHKKDGTFGNKAGEWPDVIDLDYTNKDLWDYQIETLRIWASIVDGFRCDVAPLIPLEFWLRAREEAARVKPGCLWLSESVDPGFTIANRARGMVSLSDSEIFEAFDISYDYDIHSFFKGYLEGRHSLAVYAEKINAQEYLYPANYVKLRFLENHDQSRAAFLIPDAAQRRNWTAFLYFQKGMTLIYAGQEYGNVYRPSLFDKDPIQKEPNENTERLLSALYKIKKNPIMISSSYRVNALPGDIITATHRAPSGTLTGVFSLKGRPAPARVDVPDGSYVNLIDGKLFRIEGGYLSCDGNPVIFELTAQEDSAYGTACL
jgi:glycosidase